MRWRELDALDFSQEAPPGHLPRRWYKNCGGTLRDIFSFLGQLFVQCSIDLPLPKYTFKLSKRLFIANRDENFSALQVLENIIIDNKWFKLTTDISEADYIVKINENEEYIICDRTEKPYPNLEPPLSINGTDSPERLVKRLVHLAKYQAVQGLKNPYSDLANQLEVELIGQTTPPDEVTELSNITLKSGDTATLRIKNRSLSPLNIVVLDLEPTWEISQLPLQRIAQKFYPLAPGQKITQRLRLNLPKHTNYDKGLEVIKVFAMLGEADFRWLELPPLDKEIPTAASRGLESPKGGNEELFAAIGADADRPPPTERAQVIFAPGEEWAIKEIQITVMR